jgi:hypothetical protein
MWQPPTGSFIVDRPVEASFALAYRTDESLKKLFGAALQRYSKPFEAALEVFPSDTNAALWVSWNWLTDPVVIEAKASAGQNTELNDKLLDKAALALRLLEFAEEKDPTGRFYICEAKDRLAAYKLFAEVQGFIGKIAIDASTNNITNNELKITLVKANKEKLEVSVQEPELEIDNELPANLKLVSAK